MADAQATPGELFGQLRKRRRIPSARKAADLSGLSNSTISNIERSPGRITMTSDTAGAFARLYRVPVDFILRIASGVIDELPADLDALSTSVRGPEPTRRVHAIRFLGSVSAGLTGDGVALPVDWLTVSDRFLGGYKADDLYALEVTGDSMVSQDAHLTIPSGSIVVVHESLQPRAGNVVVAWLEDEDLGVLKVFRRGADDGAVWLLSHNPDHQPIRVDDETPARIRGVMIGHWTPAQGIK